GNRRAEGIDLDHREHPSASRETAVTRGDAASTLSNTMPNSAGGAKLGKDFFSQPAIDVARQLLGSIMIRRIGRKIRRARVMEIEAYLGPVDLASHASKGL